MTSRSDAESPKAAGPPSFRSQVRSAIIWRSGSQIAGQLIAWTSTFLVLRLLSPSDYGLYAMAAAVQALLGLLNGYGLANALVQQRETTPHQWRQLFGMLLLMNIAIAAAQFLAAPLIADYYGQPIVTDLLRWMALAYLTNPFLALGYALLAREMDFRKQAQVNMGAAIVGAVTALAGALAGLGVWTLVVAPLAMYACRGFGMAIAAHAFILPSFDFRGARAIAGFGGTVTASGLLYFLQTQADVVIGGRAFDPHTLGLYTTALFLAQIFINKILPSLNEVAFSAYARVQDDRAGMAAGFLVSVRAIALIALPFCVGLAVTAKPLVATLLGAQWLEAAPILQILAISVPWMVLQVLFAPATNALNRPGITLKASALGALVMPAAFLIGVQWGVTGMATAWLLAYPLITLMTVRWSLPVIGVRAGELMAALLPPLLASAAMAAVVVIIDGLAANMPAPARLALLVAAGAAIYFGWLASFARSRLAEAIALIRRQ